MSFASETKKELTGITVDKCCQKAELAAIIRMNGTLSFSSKRMMLDVSTENAAIARRIYSFLKALYDVHADLLVRKKMRLKKNNVYIVRLPVRAQDILQDLCIMREGYDMQYTIADVIIEKACCKRAYLRGAFLAAGSVNHPDSASYHLELFTSYEAHARSLVDLLNDFHLNARWIERKKGYIVYVKEGERITEFLNIIGAHQALFQFEDARIVKDMRNSVNRLVNCETANLNKTVTASMRQLENIQLIDKHIGLDQLPDKLREIAVVRRQHPDVTLKELGELLPGGKVSKSGINHRLRKLEELAAKLRDP